MNNIWKTNVNEIIEIFRESLNTIVPIFEKAKLEWKVGKAYDEWDNVCEALFKSIVCCNLYNDSLLNYPIAEYGFTYSNYLELDYIELITNENRKIVFLSFDNTNHPFNKINVVELDKNENRIDLIKLNYDNLSFRFIKKSENKIEAIENIKVDI